MQCVCLTCYTVYPLEQYSSDGTYSICPNMSCGHEIYKIDENMIPVIIELNKKGYKTTDCCSGHNWEDVDGLQLSIYIAFAKDVQPKTVPKGFYLETNRVDDWLDPKIYGEDPPQEMKNKAVHFISCLMKKYHSDFIPENPTLLQIQVAMFNQLNDLLEWALSLPNLVEEKPVDVINKTRSNDHCYFCCEPITDDDKGEYFEVIERGRLIKGFAHNECFKERRATIKTPMSERLRTKELLLEEMGYHQGTICPHLWFLNKEDILKTTSEAAGMFVNTTHPMFQIIRTIQKHKIGERL